MLNFGLLVPTFSSDCNSVPSNNAIWNFFPTLQVLHFLYCLICYYFSLRVNQFDIVYSIKSLQCLSRALRNENPKLLMAASAAFLPVNPLMVTVIHTGMMEVNPFKIQIFINGNLVSFALIDNHAAPVRE